MFAWGLKTPLVKPGKIPEGWKPRSKAALPEVRSILKAPLPNLLCFSSSSSICFSWFLEKKLFSMILFKFVLKVKFLSQKYHLLWWHRAWVFGWRAGVASRGQTVRSGAREQKKSSNIWTVWWKSCVCLWRWKVVLGLSLYSESWSLVRIISVVAVNKKKKTTSDLKLRTFFVIKN